MQFVIAIILLIVAYAITALTSRGPQTVSAKLSDFTTPQYAEGTAQAVIFGDVWIDDFTVLWFGNFSSTPIYSTGKK